VAKKGDGCLSRAMDDQVGRWVAKKENGLLSRAMGG
jgi:hypothetical protein